MNDMNETVTISSLRLYTDDKTQYTADCSPVVLQHLLNQDMESLSSWFVSTMNYLQANEDKTQAMILGNSSYRYELEFAGTPVDIKDHLKILGIYLDNNLSFKEHIINVMLKKAYAKIGALRYSFIGASYYHILSTQLFTYGYK